MEYISAKTIVSSKGQVVIPAALREFAGIVEGTELLFTIMRDGKGEFVPTRSNLDWFIGAGKRKGHKKMSLKEIDRQIGASLLAEDERTKSKPRKKR